MSKTMSKTTGKTTSQARRRGGSSKESREAEIQQLHARLAEQVQTLRTSQGWATYLRGLRAFHNYSLNNQLLIMLCRPSATRVAGYATWRKLGRQVNRGEGGDNAIRIIAGRSFEVKEEGEKGEETVRQGVRFAPVSVFDISQTSPIPGAEHVFEEIAPERLEGADEGQIFELVADYLTGQGWPVRRDVITTGPIAYTTHSGGDHVVVDSRLSDAMAAAAVVHEAAHITLGHLEDDYAEYLRHRGRYEVEAESVAFVLAGLLGLDTSSWSTGYVAGWAETAEADVLRETADKVREAVHALAEALEGPCRLEAHATSAGDLALTA